MSKGRSGINPLIQLSNNQIRIHLTSNPMKHLKNLFSVALIITANLSFAQSGFQINKEDSDWWRRRLGLLECG